MARPRLGGAAPLVVAQGLDALNDNALKMVVSLLAVDAAVPGGSGALSLAGAAVIAPYLLFSGYAGFLADRFAKRRVLIASNAMSLPIGLLAAAALALEAFPLLLLALFLAATQSAIASPAKYGTLPELVPERELERVNGWMELTRYGAVILGTAIGGILLGLWQAQPAFIGAVFVAVALAALVALLGLAPQPAAGRSRPAPVSPWREIAAGIRRLARDRALGPAVATLTAYECLGTLIMLDVLLLAGGSFGLGALGTGLLAAATGLGIAAGAASAARLGGSDALGLVPLGAAGVGVACLLIGLAAGNAAAAFVLLGGLGFCGGLIVVPVNASLQRRAGRDEKGHLIATNNFLNMSGVLLASGLLWLLCDLAGLAPERLMLAIGLVVLGGVAAVLRWLPEYRQAARRILAGVARRRPGLA
jgi:acyl-[acyl-carrier-protein]-phospholipid O-acyltransferase/long-chain-fatty-acid--[acyl-carrier-protein] ligase